MQCLHDETRSAFNALVDELTGSAAAAQLGAAAPKGFAGKTVQAVLDELAAALGQLGGSLEMEDSTLVQLVAAAVERDLLDEYYTSVQVEEKLDGLGVDALEQRVDSMESALSQEGVVLGEVERMYPFTLPAAELAGAAELMPAELGNALCIGGELISLTAGESGMMLTKVKPLEGVITSAALSGNPLPLTDASKGFEPLWADPAGEYMLVKAASVWYLVSLKTGACAQLVSGSENTFCGAARVGNIVTAVFHNDGNLWFYRRSVAGDSGTQPALTALDTYHESGSALDRVLNVYGGVFVMLKYNAAASVMKAYEPGNMLAGAEVSTGLAGAFVHSGARIDGASCLFLMEKDDGSRYQAKCVLAADNTLSLTVGETEMSGSRIICGINGMLCAVAGETVYAVDSDTLAVQATMKLPAAVPDAICSVEGAVLGEPWGGKYVLLDGWLLNVEDMTVRALRCDGAAPAGYALLPAAQRYFAAHTDSRWYFFDSLLRPVWGMVPYVTAGEA
ncbi:MAG: hypothetical protein IKL27_07910 [Oscillospiraceae bacterium]|nr:hypothetical protein [Oscillospiraceae bacterium]